MRYLEMTVKRREKNTLIFWRKRRIFANTCWWWQQQTWALKNGWQDSFFFFPPMPKEGSKNDFFAFKVRFSLAVSLTAEPSSSHLLECPNTAYRIIPEMNEERKNIRFGRFFQHDAVFSFLLLHDDPFTFCHRDEGNPKMLLLRYKWRVISGHIVWH